MRNTDPQGERGSTSGASRISRALGPGGRPRPDDRRAGTRLVTLIPPSTEVAASAAAARRRRDEKAELVEPLGPPAREAGTEHDLTAWYLPDPGRRPGLGAFRAPGDDLARRSGTRDPHAGRYGEPGDAVAPTRATAHLSQRIRLFLVTRKAGRFEGHHPSGFPAREREPAAIGAFSADADAAGAARPREDRTAPPAEPEAGHRPTAPAVPWSGRPARRRRAISRRRGRPGMCRSPASPPDRRERPPHPRPFPAPPLSPQGVRDRPTGSRQRLRRGRAAARGELNQEQAHPGGTPGVNVYKEDP